MKLLYGASVCRLTAGGTASVSYHTEGGRVMDIEIAAALLMILAALVIDTLMSHIDELESEKE